MMYDLTGRTKILYGMHSGIYTISIIISASMNYCERGNIENEIRTVQILSQNGKQQVCEQSFMTENGSMRHDDVFAQYHLSCR